MVIIFLESETLPATGATSGFLPSSAAATTSPTSTSLPVSTCTVLSPIVSLEALALSSVIWMTYCSLSSHTATLPEMSAKNALPLGTRTSKSSSTRGRPWVMSSAIAAPPEWKVRNVSWVPGSPILWAAITPTGVWDATRLPVAGSIP